MFGRLVAWHVGRRHIWGMRSSKAVVLTVLTAACCSCASSLACAPKYRDTDWYSFQRGELKQALVEFYQSDRSMGSAKAILGRPDKVDRQDGAAVASWASGSARGGGTHMCGQAVEASHHVFFAVAELRFERDALQACHVYFRQYIGDEPRPDPYEATPISESTTECSEFL